MAAISQTIFSDAFSWMKSFVVWLRFHWRLFSRGPIDNNPSLRKMARCRIADKPLSEPMLTQFTDAYMRHWGHLTWGSWQASLVFPNNRLQIGDTVTPNIMSNYFIDKVHMVWLIVKTQFYNRQVSFIWTWHLEWQCTFHKQIHCPSIVWNHPISASSSVFKRCYFFSNNI